MVHEKYIKRGNKVFGPYLYTNYRENGITKTRYLGKGKEIKKKKNGKKLRVNKSFLIVLGAILVIGILTIIFFQNRMFIDIEFLKGRLASEKSLAPFVNILPNSGPNITGIPSEFLVCENRDLIHYFNVSDPNGISDIRSVTITPADPFFIGFVGDVIGPPDYRIYRIWSRILEKIYINNKRVGNQGWATYTEQIKAEDRANAFDLFTTYITIIEVNNPPNITNIGIQTIEIWTYGDNTVFDYQIQVEDNESGDQNSGKLNFSLAYSNGTEFNLFNISKNGTMFLNATGNQSLLGAYDLTICINDTDLENPHPNVSLCVGQQWWGWDNVCTDFTLVVTNRNRPPEIVDYYPLNLSLNVSGNDVLYFNVSSYDPDWNLTDIYWYVDGREEKYDNRTLFSEFNYIFGCGVSGNHTVRAVATDGLANASVQWNLSVLHVTCYVPGPSGPGGGAGGMHCEEEWGCEDWSQCKNLRESFEAGEIDNKREILIRERCEIFNWVEEICGFQTRNCTDFNYCRTNYTIPGIIKECYYTEHPNCTDGIRNCHDGSCEVLVDCGGPCVVCPTCNDRIQNQGEEGVDCGGPCSPCIEIPFTTTLIKMIISYSLLLLLILVIILVIKQILEYKKFKKEAKTSPKKFIKEGHVARFVFLFVTIILLFFANTYIMNIAQKDKITLTVGDEGFLFSRSLINSFLRTFADIFLINIERSIIGPTNADLAVWSDPDDPLIQKFTQGTLYGKTIDSWNVSFYANYTDKSGIAINPANGDCEIEFYDAPFTDMDFDSISGLWVYSRGFIHKEERDFNINCTSVVYDDLNLSTITFITNTPPQINLSLPRLYFYEDNPDSYNFSWRVLEDDKNDVLIFSLENISDSDPINYPWITMNGSLISVDATDPTQLGFFSLDIQVTDTSGAAMLNQQNITILPTNDAPVFTNLENRTFVSGDLFSYLIDIYDEEGDAPFVFEVTFLSGCSAEITRGNCTLFAYAVDAQAGILNISFIPNTIDVGSYLINFSVMDNNTLGNKTTSQIVNFTVQNPIWLDPLSEHTAVEGQPFYLNLSENVTWSAGQVIFSSDIPFPDFDLTSEGIVDFTPDDSSVGFWEVEITAQNSQTTSPKMFNFTVLNANDSVLVKPIENANNVLSIDNSNIIAFENADIEIFLFVEDNDLLISQKSFYDENITLFQQSIVGPNPSLFTFNFASIIGNATEFNATFKPGAGDVGVYNITINATDANNFSTSGLMFNLTILSRAYDTPNITYPNASEQFNLKENTTYNLIFRANHTMQDSLTYRFYINDNLKYEILLGDGDNGNVTWQFTPNFTDETYGEVMNLTLLVINPYPLYSDLNATRIWNLTINHTNAPVEFVDVVDDPIVLPYNYALGMDLKDHFFDIDSEDPHYNQSIHFLILSNETPTRINPVNDILTNWSFVLSPRVAAAFREELNITACDINESTGENMSCTTSNNFTVEFVPPVEVEVPVPEPYPEPSSGSSSTGQTIISLKIITPGLISGYENDTIEIPLELYNRGQKSFNDLTLTSSAFKDGDITNEIETSLDKDAIDVLRVGQRENLTLTAFLGTDKLGDYEILVNVTSRSPKYTDWGKIHIHLQAINESSARDLIVFTEELLAENPQCIEITEIVEEAEEYFDKGDYVNARLKTKEAINACRDVITQVSIPKGKGNIFDISLYLVITVLLAFVLGIVYYFIKRRRFKKSINLDVKNKTE